MYVSAIISRQYHDDQDAELEVIITIYNTVHNNHHSSTTHVCYDRGNELYYCISYYTIGIYNTVTITHSIQHILY